MEKRKKDRIWYLECLRVLAMLSVISFHVSKTALSDFSFSLFTSSCLLCVRNLVHYAVPIFFMISGALLLNPNKNLSIERLCKHYLIKYLLITVLFGGVYSCLEQIFDKKTISWPVIRSGIDNMIHGDSWAHMWYMYTLIWVMMLLPVLRLIVYKFKKEEIKYTIVVPNNLAWWIINASDRTIVAHFLGTAANGIYSIANKFPNVFINFYDILNLSWTETVSLHYGDEDRDEFLTETMTSLFKMFSAACFGIVACMPFVFPIMINAKYAAAYDQILILMYAMLFRVLVGLYSCVYVAQKNAKKIAYTSMSAAIINIIVDLVLINKIQVFAASFSTLIAFLSMFIIRYIDVNKTVHMKIRKPIIIGTVLIGLMLVGTYYCENKTVQFVAFCITAIYAVLINVDMLKTGINLVKSRLEK